MTELVNTGIDSPVSGSADSRPMWSWITDFEEYTEQYQEALDALISGYFESGAFEKEFDALYEMLAPYVEKDSSYSADEFKAGYETLKSFALARAESIRAQLDGTLATVTSEQEEAQRVDASNISIKAMGAMNMGKAPKA